MDTITKDQQIARLEGEAQRQFRYIDSTRKTGGTVTDDMTRKLDSILDKLDRLEA